jgi:hypothetical protein
MDVRENALYDLYIMPSLADMAGKERHSFSAIVHALMIKQQRVSIELVFLLYLIIKKIRFPWFGPSWFRPWISSVRVRWLRKISVVRFFVCIVHVFRPAVRLSCLVHVAWVAF